MANVSTRRRQQHLKNQSEVLRAISNCVCVGVFPFWGRDKEEEGIKEPDFVKCITGMAFKLVTSLFKYDSFNFAIQDNHGEAALRGRDDCLPYH
jgi:hypothetical protein